MDKHSTKNLSSDYDFKLSLSCIKDFAAYLIENFEKASDEYIRLYLQGKESLFEFLDVQGKQELKQNLREDFKIFLNGLYHGNIVEKELLKIDKKSFLRLLDLPEIDATLQPPDNNVRFDLIHSIFYSFLPAYTDNLHDGINILKEFEEIRSFFSYRISSLQIDLHQEKLRREKDFAESLINHSTNGILSFNNDLTVSLWNKKMESISGIKREFVLGKNIFELFPGYRETEEGSAIFKVLKGEKVFISERAFANERGFYEANAIPIFGVDDIIIGGFIVFNDTTRKNLDAKRIEETKVNLQYLNEELTLQIHQLKRTQEELRRNEKLLRKSQQLAHMGNWIWDVRNNKIQYSEELCNIFGIDYLSPYDTIKGYLQKVHNEDRSLFLKRIRDAVRSGNPFSYQHRIISSKPEEGTKFVYGEGIPEMENGKLRITGFAQDITMKMKALKTLQASENRFKTLCEKSPDAIFLLDIEGILYCNLSAISIFGGQTKSQFLGQSLLKFTKTSGFPDFGLTELRENLKRSFEGESLRFECVFNNLSGNSFWAEVILTPIQLEERNVIHAVIRDISHRKQIENQIKLAQEELEKINNELESRIEERTKDLEEINKNLMRVNADMDNFIYSASHDLKAPILNIEGLINELVQHESYQNVDVKTLVDMMMVCVQKFIRTINDLTEITNSLRADSFDEHINNLEEVIGDIEISVQNLIGLSHAEIVCDFSDCNSVVFSRKNLYSVLYNLICNAIKYRSPERNPLIIVHSKDLGSCIQVSVKDNGLGIKEKDREKVFLMFKRAHNHVEGTGVGLYLVKRIMENAGGKVEVKSELGEGSEFILYFNKPYLSV